MTTQRFQVPLSKFNNGYWKAVTQVTELLKDEKIGKYICIDNRNAKLVLKQIESETGFNWSYFVKNCNTNSESGTYVIGKDGKVYFRENAGNYSKGSLAKPVLVTKITIFTEKYIIQ